MIKNTTSSTKEGVGRELSGGLGIIITVNINLKIGNVTLVQVDGPTDEGYFLYKVLFYSDLERVIQRTRNQGRSIIIMRDLNARIGINNTDG